VGVDQYDLDDPVRLTATNADKNIINRSWSDADPQEILSLVDYGPSSDNKLPPQIATMFSPHRVPTILANYQVIDWLWTPETDPGLPNGPITSPPVTLIGVEPNVIEELRSPKHGRHLGAPLGKGGAVVLYADVQNITLKFTLEDSVATGYTMHISGICTDPNLVALYQSLDDQFSNPGRYLFGPDSGNIPRDGIPDYLLPGLKQGQVFGIGFPSVQTFIAIRYEGTFLDPRSEQDWWQIQP
jgi:hypothetical protein